MTTAVRTVYGRFEVRPWWFEHDELGVQTGDIVSSTLGDVPEQVQHWADEHDDGLADPDGYGVYEETSEGPQHHLCDTGQGAEGLEIAQRIAHALQLADKAREVVDFIAQEPPDPEAAEPAIRTRYTIRTGYGRPRPVLVEWETNDDNDDGYDDGEVTRDEYRFFTIDDALSFTGRTRVGLYGQRVTVTLDGVELS